MREIKFRAFDKRKNIFLKGYSSVECLEQSENGTREDIILMQSTGILDKNGKEIYEGDIVTVQLVASVIKSEVGYENGFFGVHTLSVSEMNGISSKNFSLYPIGKITNYQGNFEGEIIGNIYENPDLLNKK